MTRSCGNTGPRDSCVPDRRDWARDGAMGLLNNREALGLPSSLPRALAAAAAGFVDEYLGRPGAPVPFAGSDDELARLDAWLARAELPVALVVSEAGRGKSALLVRWAAAQAERAGSSAAAPR